MKRDFLEKKKLKIMFRRNIRLTTKEGYIFLPWSGLRVLKSTVVTQKCQSTNEAS